MFVELPLIIFLFLLIFFLGYFMVSFFTGAPFVVTPKHIVNEMLQVAQVTTKDTVADLGSGDGRFLIAAAQIGATAKGWEINPFLVLWTLLMAHRYGVSNTVHVYNQPYQKANLKSTSVVIFYNIPSHLPNLELKLQKELRKGTRVVSYKFPLSKFTLRKQTKSGIYVYVI